MLPVSRFAAMRRTTAHFRIPSVSVHRAPATIALRAFSSAWDDQPAPPRLPPEQQAEFEKLVRQAQESAAAASLADAVAAANAKAAEEAAAAAEAGETQAEASAASAKPATETPSSALNGNPIEGVWRGAAPEFDGDRNPKTGEVGGPKNEPLRWGSSGDWSFNGRVTDF
ncbi:hypothetical protein SPBR_01072 [Sporothrix brasiliensis 5110]|uniref:Succinate dehydrogenase assembly factor 4, mitochondrial n=1 Tax=Sporothrix brasiliensis 5110 TaxID=1398154 RepID=A0A0C2ILK4_9PEZI|nr:uncharacterized protein SPBR_01072 [Sporothrix brasiliensis 5110]KIH89971.1 hypothetical protein SPBR_01072 [Sporothrix brasiliensis 5110]